MIRVALCFIVALLLSVPDVLTSIISDKQFLYKGYYFVANFNGDEQVSKDIPLVHQYRTVQREGLAYSYQLESKEVWSFDVLGENNLYRLISHRGNMLAVKHNWVAFVLSRFVWLFFICVLMLVIYFYIFSGRVREFRQPATEKLPRLRCEFPKCCRPR